MKKFVEVLAVAFVTACTVFGSLSTQAQWSKEQSKNVKQVLIKGGWLIDGLDDERRPNTGLLIQGDHIQAVDLKPDLAELESVEVIQLTDNDTVLPGMFDLHAHYNLDFLGKGRVEEVIYNGTIFLANGVTSTWSAGEYYPERVISQRDRVDAGRSVGPRLFASGPYFGAFRCEYNVKVAADDCIGWPNDITESEIRQEVDNSHHKKVISIKIKQATPDEMRIIIDQAHKNGMTTAAHLANYNVEYDVHLRDAIKMGLDRVEHQLTLGSGGALSDELPEMIELMITNGVFYDANLQMYGGINERRAHADEMLWTNEAKYFTSYAQGLLIERGDPPPESDAKEFSQREFEVKALYKAGGANLLIVGTDEPVYTSLLPGFAYHRELLALTYAGISPIDVLKAATINGARALGVEDELGSIELGKLADLVIVRGNPLEDIKVARDITFVIKNGVTYNPQKLLQSVEGKIGPTGVDDHARWKLKFKPLRYRESL